MLFSRKSIFVYLMIVVSCAFLVFTYSDIFTKEEMPQVKFNGEEDHSISLSEASELTANFQKQITPNQVIGGYFGKNAIINILQQDGAVGLRYYYGLDKDGLPHIVLVGVDKNGNDMINGLLAQRSAMCPPYCPEDNDLNSPLLSMELSSNF
ncbi:MAG: hypothetical protein ACE5HS_17580 [bacterium]